MSEAAVKVRIENNREVTGEITIIVINIL